MEFNNDNILAWNNLEVWDLIRRIPAPIERVHTPLEEDAMMLERLHPEDFNYLRDW